MSVDTTPAEGPAGAATTETAATTTAADQATEVTTLLTEQSAPDAAGTTADNEGAEGEAAAGEDGEKKAEGEKPAGAPDAYADFTAPEGVKLDVELTGELKAVAKEFNLSQEQAQRLADMGAKLQQKGASQTTEMLAQARAEWTKAAQTDTEYGGDKLPQNMAVARKAMDQFGTPELKQLLNQSGLGNHPEIIRVFYRAGLAISEDSKFVAGGVASGGPKSNEEVFYGSTSSAK